MDISVSHLNRRMALQIPAEFPLGLVFVVGEVTVDSFLVNQDDLREFYLLEEDHQLLCRLSPRVAEEISLQQGDLVRAGGHIVFDPARARYFLLARDVELLREYEPAGAALGGLISAGLPSQDPELVPAPLPQWVKELAPPEVQEDWIARRMAATAGTMAAAVAEVTPAKPEPAAQVIETVTPAEPEPEAQVIETVMPAEPEPAALAIESWQEYGELDVNLAFTMGEPALAELSDELIAFLSEAIDSNEVVELTPAIMAELAPVSPLAPTRPPVQEIAPVTLAPDPERAYAAQDASIEEFLGALEAAISADETHLDGQEPGRDSMNGQAALDLASQIPDSASQSAAGTLHVSAAGSQTDPIQTDQTNSFAPAGSNQSSENPQKQPKIEPAPKRKRQQADKLPWFIFVLAILAGILLLAIFVALVIGSGLIPSIAV